MNEFDLQQLAQEMQTLPAPVELIVSAAGNDPFFEELQGFARLAAGIAPGKITVSARSVAVPPLNDARLTIAGLHAANVHYACVPEQREIRPFAHALVYAAQGDAPLPAAARKLAKQIAAPAEIMVFISSFCPSCPLVVEAAVSLAALNSLLSVLVLDVQRFSRLAQQHDITSVPAVLIDNSLLHVGEITAQRMAEILVHRGTKAYDRDLMRSLIDRAKIVAAAELLCQEKDADGMLALFADGDLSMRMGVLVVFEEALEKNRDAVQEMVPKLINMLASEDPRIRGDIADLLGKVGDVRALPHLERLTADPDPDVVDAAEEALEMIRGA